MAIVPKTPGFRLWLGCGRLLDSVAIHAEGVVVAALKILEKPDSLRWDYDEEADVLYPSIGKPTPAVGVEIGEGVVVRYDVAEKQIVGLTSTGLRARLLKNLPDAP